MKASHLEPLWESMDECRRLHRPLLKRRRCKWKRSRLLPKNGYDLEIENLHSQHRHRHLNDLRNEDAGKLLFGSMLLCILLRPSKYFSLFKSRTPKYPSRSKANILSFPP
jgi:hypothetical protein